MTYEDIVFDYNNRALDDRTWDMISDRERVEFVLRVRGMQEPVCYQALFDAIAAATSVAYAQGINISIEAFTAKIGPLYTAPQPCPSCEVNEAIGAGNAELIEMLQAECKKLKAERDDLTEELRLSKLNAGNWHKQFMVAMEERGELAAQVDAMRDVLKEYSLKENDGMNGSFRVCCSTRPNEPHANCECSEALALPDLSTGILNRVRAEALRQAADICNVHATMATNQDGAEWSNSCETAIRALAHDMEAGKCKLY